MKSPVKKIREELEVTQRQLTQAVLGNRNDTVIRSLERGRTSLDRSYDVKVGETSGEKKKSYIFLKNLAKLTDVDFDFLLKKQKELEKAEIQKIRDKMDNIDFELN